MSHKEIIAAIDIAGQTQDLKRNEALIFNDPDKVWYVETGLIDLQNTKFHNNMPTGGRHSLFQVLAKNTIFGSSPDEASAWQGWVGIALEDTRVREMQFSQYATCLKAETETCHAMIMGWINVIHRNMGTDNKPPSTLYHLPEEGEYEFGTEEAFTALTNDFLMVRIRSGAMALFGMEEYRIGPEHGYFLLGAELWAKVMTDVVEMDVLFRPRSDEGAELKEALSSLHACFGLYLQGKLEEEQKTEIERRKTSKEQEDLATVSAVEDLASVLYPMERFPKRETPLLTVVSVVGQVLGVKIMPQAASEDMSRINDPIEPIARASKLRYRKILFSPEWWKRDSGPLVAFLGEERKPVALLPHGTGYHIVDPEKRQREPLTHELREQIHANAFMFYRPLKTKVEGVVDLLRFSSRGKVGDMLFIVLMGTISTLLGMVVPRATGALVDAAIPSADRMYVYQLAMVLTAASIGAAIFTFLQAMTTVRMTSLTELVVQSALWDRLLKFSPRFFRFYSSGDLQTRVNAVSEVSRELSAATLKPLFSGVLSLLNFLLLWYYSWDLAKIAIWIGLAVLLIIMVVGHFVRKLSIKQLHVEGEYHGLVIQMIGGVGKIRVSGSEQRATNYWLSKYSQQLRLILQIQRLKDIVTVVHQVLPPIASAILFWKAVDLTIGLPVGDEARISMGEFLVFNTAFVLYLSGWSDLSSALVEVLDNAAKGERIKPLLEEQSEVKDDASDPGRLKGNIRLENIMFRYTKDGPLILDNVSCEVNPGEYIAFVGASGSGKSTLLRIILGFETSDSGRVLYDGQDLGGLDVLAVRRQIGSVLQNGRLNAGSIIENISNNARLTHTEIWEAVADAGLTEDIENMPMGLHTVVSEGGFNLSCGQRQRLLIARALAIRPRIVMFDEATSALDNKTQAVVSKSLDRRKVTRVVIAHRLSTIRQADRIYVLDRGGIVQQGSFDELSREEGLFRDLMIRQMI